MLEGLARRDFSALDLLAVWIDGIQLGKYHVIGAAGVNDQGKKHLLGLREGATENAEVAKALLEDLARRGPDLKRRRLFVMDGSLALRGAIDRIFGVGTLVTLPQPQAPECPGPPSRSPARARSLDAQGRVQAGRQGSGGAARKVRHVAGASLARRGGLAGEGLDEMFTINRLGLPSELRWCLGTTNLIDNGHSALRDRVRRVKNWQDGAMALRWTAVAFDAISKGFRRIMCYKHIWILKAALDEPSRDRSLDDQACAG